MELTNEEKMMLAAKQQILLQTAKNDNYKGTRRNLPILDDAGFYIVDAKTGKNRGPVVMDPFDDISVEEAYNEVHDNLVRACIEAGGDLRAARELLTRALEQLYLLGYDSGFTSPEINQLAIDINNFLEDAK